MRKKNNKYFFYRKIGLNLGYSSSRKFFLEKFRGGKKVLYNGFRKVCKVFKKSTRLQNKVRGFHFNLQPSLKTQIKNYISKIIYGLNGEPKTTSKKSLKLELG